MAEFQDRVLKCMDCGTDFVFSAGEQQFYREKDFRNEPKRCRTCKNKRQSASSERGSHGGRVETTATCFQCGRETTVPFRPTQGRPVLCRDCFQDRKGGHSAPVSG